MTTLKCTCCGAGFKPNSGRCDYCGVYFVNKHTYQGHALVNTSGMISCVSGIPWSQNAQEAFADYIRPTIEELYNRNKLYDDSGHILP